MRIEPLTQKKIIGSRAILTANWLASPQAWAVKMNGERMTKAKLKELGWVKQVIEKQDSEFDVIFPRQPQKFIRTEFMVNSPNGILSVFVAVDGSAITCFTNAVVQEMGIKELWGFGTSQPYVNSNNQSAVTAILYPDPTEVQFPVLGVLQDIPDDETDDEEEEELEEEFA